MATFPSRSLETRQQVAPPGGCERQRVGYPILCSYERERVDDGRSRNPLVHACSYLSEHAQTRSAP